MKNKTIYLLLGQKGSGKSYIGTLVHNHFNIRFISVEQWVKEIQSKPDLDDDTYLKQVFQVIENGVRAELKQTDNLAFESTGLTAHFAQMFQSLCNDFNVITIKVSANPETCLQRVQSRDQRIHINLSEQQVKFINHQIIDENRTTDFVINNNNKTEEELLDKLKRILQ